MPIQPMTKDPTYPHITSNQTKKISVKTGYKEENPLQIYYVELTLEVANHISNIFVRYDHLFISSQFILVCK